jgi:bla regulator protein blaR1
MEILNQSFVDHLGWTLVHASWQALVFLGLYFMVFMGTTKAAIRYWAGIALQAAQLLASVATFAYLSTRPNALVHQQIFMAQNMPITAFQAAIVFIKTNLQLFVNLWSVGMLVLLVRLVLGYVTVYKLKTHPSNQANTELQNLSDSLRSKMNLGQDVLLKITNQVSLPMIMGVFKPTILIPASLLTGFSTAQLEAIIAHELAHLKRHDFLINGIQSFIEILFFFHPAMWILGSQIRRERENCCDDIAVAYTNNKVLLAKSLVQLQEIGRTPSLAMTFGNKKMSFVERIQRIVGINQPKSITKESIVIVLGLFLTFVAFAQTKPQEYKKAKKKETSKTFEIKNHRIDSLKEDTFQISIQNEKDKFEIKDDKAYFNGKEVEVSNKEQFQKELNVLKQKHDALNKASDNIQEHSEKLSQKVSQSFSQSLLESIQTTSLKMGKLGEKIGEISQLYANKLVKKGLSEKEVEEITKKFEEDLAFYERKMDKLEAEMEYFSEQMEEHNPALEKMEQEIELLEAPIDKISKEIDSQMETIIELLPYNIKARVAKGLHDLPIPPPLPKAAKAPKALPTPPKPPRPPKVPNN